MGSPGKPHWAMLDRRSSTLFLAAGGVLVVFAALNGVGAFTGISMEYNGFEFGYVLGFLGLLGLYPTVVDRNPWLARAGAIAAGAGMIAISVFTVYDLSQLAGITSGDPPAWSLFVFLALLGFIAGYLCFGVASLRSDSYSRTVGLALLVPAIIVVVMVAHIAAGFASDQTAFVISTGQAMAHLAIGATLRTKTSQAERDAPASSGDVELATHE